MIGSGVLVVLTGCRTLHHDKNKQEAQQHWREVRGRFKYQLARQQYDGGLFREAVATATEAISLYPKEPDAYVVLARANLELGMPAAATDAIDAAKSAGLRSPALNYTRGVIHEERGELNYALNSYRQARTQDLKEVDFFLAEVETLVALDRVDEARNLLDEIGPGYDDRASVATLAAHVAILQGDNDRAIELYRVALAEGTESRTISRELGLLFAQSGRCDQAISLIRPLIDGLAKREDEALLRRTLASCYLQLGANDSAREVIAPILALNPDDALGQLLLAKSLVASNDLLGAARAVDLAYKAAPDRTEVWFVRAVVEWKRGDFDAAADALYDVLANNPNDVEAMCLLGEVLKATQRSDGAKGYFERALQADPSSPWAKVGLSRLPGEHTSDAALPGQSLTAAQ